MKLNLFTQKSNYRRSNAITKINFSVSENARRAAAELLAGKSESARQKLGNKLLNELAGLAKIEAVKLTISSAKQYHKKINGKIAYRQYGYYKPGAKYIYINNRTAARGKTIAPKSFLDTLLHEWMHHYDRYKLGLNSIHTAGFYSRLKDLKEKIGYFKLNG